MDEYALTTLDNPYSPFTEFGQWLSFDIAKGYDTCGLIARQMPLDYDDYDDELKELLRQTALDTIVELNPLGIHILCIRK